MSDGIAMGLHGFMRGIIPLVKGFTTETSGSWVLILIPKQILKLAWTHNSLLFFHGLADHTVIFFTVWQTVLFHACLHFRCSLFLQFWRMRRAEEEWGMRPLKNRLPVLHLSSTDLTYAMLCYAMLCYVMIYKMCDDNDAVVIRFLPGSLLLCIHI